MVVFRLIHLAQKLRRNRSIGLVLVLVLLATNLLGNFGFFHVFEGREQGSGWGDAMWYRITSITTIGYGNISAETVSGRLGTLFFVVVLGLATFFVAIGMGVDWVSETIANTVRATSTTLTQDHIVIVNFSSESRVAQVIQELRNDLEYQDKKIVIITDSVEQLPFSRQDIIFIRGPVLEAETYQRASASKATMAIVLATSYRNSSSDVVVASIVSVLNEIEEEMHIVAECINPNRRSLFRTASGDAIVYSMQKTSGNLLAQEVHEPGVAQLIDVIRSNSVGATLFSIAIPDHVDLDYQELAQKRLRCDVNFLRMNRGEKCITAIRDPCTQVGDRFIYVGSEQWESNERQQVLKLEQIAS